MVINPHVLFIRQTHLSCTRQRYKNIHNDNLVIVTEVIQFNSITRVVLSCRGKTLILYIIFTEMSRFDKLVVANNINYNSTPKSQ